MVHPGKHTIDPETGLCEICDQGAIQDIQQGKRPSKHVFYDDYDGRHTYRSHPNDIPYAKDRYVYEVVDEPKPRYIRQVVYPKPTVRPRRAIYEQPVEEPLLIRRRVIRREHTPPEEVMIRRPAPRPKAYYYVDKEGQMVPQTNTPPAPPPRRYIVQTKEVPPPPPPLRTTPPPPVSTTGRTVRVVRRQIQTPPPPATEVWHTGPKRQINSDTEIVDRQQRIRRTENYYSPRLEPKPELYHLEGAPDEVRYSPVNPPMYSSREYRTPSPRVVEQSPPIRKPANRIEPIPKKVKQPTPTVVRRVYEKLPPGKQQPGKQTDRNGVPKNSSRINNKDQRNLESDKNPSIYYIRSVDNHD